MMLAVSWADAAVWITVISAVGFVAAIALSTPFTPFRGAPSIGPKKLEAIEDDLGAIRADLADIKESLAELDRLFKSVG
jgi:hypothetical protein